MTRTLVALALIAVLGPITLAHEGHDHNVMGTVVRLHENHLEVKAVKDGKTTVVTLNDKTKIRRDKSLVTRSDIKVGDRVVVTYAQEKDAKGNDVLIAKEVRLGAAGKATVS
jgi:hypothetical protein